MMLDQQLPIYEKVLGASNSWLQASAAHGLSGAVGFYGHPTRIGGADEGIPIGEVMKFERALELANVEHDIHIFPDAPHSFFDRRYGDFIEESTEAWDRLISFIGKNS